MSIEAITPSELSELVDRPRLLKQGISKVKAMNDYLANHKPIKTVTFENMEMQKKANNVRYYDMWKNGDKLIANSILLTEGLSQRLSPKQEEFLTQFDTKHNL